MSKNAISANPEHCRFIFFWGGPLQALKRISPRGSKSFFGIDSPNPQNKKSLDR